MFADSDKIEIAKVTKTFGTNGELFLRLYDAFPDKVNTEEPMFVVLNGLTVPLFIRSFARKGVSKAVVVFDDIDTEYRAGEFVGSTLLLSQQEDDSQEDDFFWDDLVGFDFEDLTSGRKGVITDFLENGKNPLFEASVADITVFIPANEDLIRGIDETTIVFELPEGLMDIYFED